MMSDRHRERTEDYVTLLGTTACQTHHTTDDDGDNGEKLRISIGSQTFEDHPTSKKRAHCSGRPIMSQVYSTEPSTSGRVILDTTHGPIEIQLWCRECPTATKMFLRLCLDGFYDNMVFHRIAPNFLIQTGALRIGSEEQELGKEDNMMVYRRAIEAEEALARRSYELNSRIRFNHRGQVAMALEVDAQDDATLLQPQFFITLDEASFLDGKHVLFGTVSGPTIFNCLRIGKTDVDDSNQPTMISEAPRIQRVRIMENPIHSDIVPSVIVPWKIKKNEEPKKKKKRRGVKNVNVLSFGDEFEVDSLQSVGIKSMHKVPESKRQTSEMKKNTNTTIPATMEDNRKIHQKLNNYQAEQKIAEVDETMDSAKQPISETDSGSEQIKGVESDPGLVVSNIETQTKGDSSGSLKSDAQAPKVAKSEEVRSSLVAARRAKYANGGNKTKRKREEDTLSKLKLFQSKIAKVSAKDGGKREDDEVGYHGQILESNADDGGWMSTKFQCRKHMDIDAKLGGDGRNALEDYEVIEDVGDRNNYHKKTGRRYPRTDEGN